MNESTIEHDGAVVGEGGGAPMNATLIEPDDFEEQLIARRVRVAPYYVAVTTTMVALWSYLVVGEFVLAGVPEWLGWATVLMTIGSYYWAQERRLFVYMMNNTPRQRAVALLVICLMILTALLMASLLGLLLPEPVVTAMLLALLGVAAWWQRGVRLRHYALLWQDEGWRKLGKVAFVGVFTIFALGALIARQ
jgi:hypothetical protein